MVASAQMQPSSLCDLFLTLHTCLAARDQTGTGQKQQKPGQGKGFLFHSIQHTPGHVCSTLCLRAPQYKTHSDLLQQFHLMDKKRPRQPGWISLKRRKQMGKTLLESSNTSCTSSTCKKQRKQSWALQGKEQMQLHGKFLCC